MRYLLLLVVLFSFASVRAQKVDVDDGIVAVDGTPYCKLVKKDCKLGLCDFSVQTLDGTEIAFIKWREYNDKDKQMQSNPNGRVLFYDWTFLGTGAKCETDQISAKNVAKILVDGPLMKDGVLNPDGEKKIVLVNGMRHSERMKVLNATIIIIQN
ncbi:MAG: hypothetical protein IPI55_05255 [Flavobacteriales bacterium]|nr:hypothetical protein [Flavobacteriales bacterium]